MINVIRNLSKLINGLYSLTLGRKTVAIHSFFITTFEINDNVFEINSIDLDKYNYLN